MSVTIKSAREIELMRAAGKILAKVHQNLGEALRPGMSTYEIDRLGEEMIRSYGCIPSFKDYQGYPASVCVFQIRNTTFRKATSSALTSVSSTKDIIRMRHAHTE